MYNAKKWPNILLKILWCEHRKIFKVYLAIFHYYARILTGKKLRQMKLQRLQKVQIWAFGLW